MIPPIPVLVRETILVVENHKPVLEAVSNVLVMSGYTVLMASSPDEAIQTSRDFPGTIHLLLTDVMMRVMSGPDLAQKLIEQRKDMRFMCMTGYPDGALLLLNYGWHLIKKPFLAKVLLEKIETVLHTPDRSQGTDHFDTRD